MHASVLCMQAPPFNPAAGMQCKGSSILCMHACARRSMHDLWDEGHTDACRGAFIAGMYKPAATPSAVLSDGRSMPVLGVSTWLKASVQATVEDALRSGCRCAAVHLHVLPVV